MTNDDAVRPSGSAPSADRGALMLNLADIPMPTMGGEEARIGGWWAMLADRYPYTDSLNLWRASLCGLYLQAAINKDVGPIYVRPFGWVHRIEGRRVYDEYDEEIGVEEAHTQHAVGAELIDATGYSWSWAVELVRVD